MTTHQEALIQEARKGMAILLVGSALGKSLDDPVPQEIIQAMTAALAVLKSSGVDVVKEVFEPAEAKVDEIISRALAAKAIEKAAKH